MTELAPSIDQQVAREDVVSAEMVATVPGEVITGLLRKAEARAGYSAQLVAKALMCGKPWYMAAMAGGIDQKTLTRWRRNDAELNECLEECERIGFAATVETEMYRRAMAGPDDRASAQLLVTVAKARREEYRDKQQVTLAIHAAAQSASSAIDGDYRPAS